MECDARPGLGCLIYGTATCVHRKRQRGWRSWLGVKARTSIELWWLLVAAMPIVLLYLWAWIVQPADQP